MMCDFESSAKVATVIAPSAFELAALAYPAAADATVAAVAVLLALFLLDAAIMTANPGVALAVIAV